jgi:hypothetical protein
MKPKSEIEGARFPRTDYFFHSGADRWRGYWSSDDGRHFHRHNLGREFLIESARERAKEMVVFGVILIAAAWPLVYMIITIWQVLHRHGLDQLP